MTSIVTFAFSAVCLTFKRTFDFSNVEWKLKLFSVVFVLNLSQYSVFYRVCVWAYFKYFFNMNIFFYMRTTELQKFYLTALKTMSFENNSAFFFPQKNGQN